MPDRGETIGGVEVAAYTVPTDAPESDGTLAWTATTMVVVHVHAGGAAGMGYTYGPAATADVVAELLAPCLEGHAVLAPQAAWDAMRVALRNAGQAGIGALALSAVDIALHDLRARRLGLPLWRALGARRDHVAVYGSGGFTSYDARQLGDQLAAWTAQGIDRVKIKVGRDPRADPGRLATARAAIGSEVALMVDANGAFTPEEALRQAEVYAAFGVDWLEEPVSSDDLPGLRHVRSRAPAGMAVAAGEYCWSPLDAARLLEADAVDVLQADVTRCGGITGLLQIDALAAAHGRPFSAHCAPAISAQVGCAMQAFRHLEYFHDHTRIESLLLDGVPPVVDGTLHPSDAPGHGLQLRRTDAERWRRQA